MANGDRPYTLDRVVRLVLGVATLVAVLALLRYLSDVLLPFVAAVVLAYLLNPLVTAFEKKTRRRGLAVAITLCGMGVTGLALVAIVVPLMIGQVRQFGDSLQKLQGDLTYSVELALGPEEVPADSRSRADATERPTESSTAPAKSVMGWRELRKAWTEYRKNAGRLARSERLAQFRLRLSGTYIGDAVDRTIRYTRSEEFNKLLVDLAKRVAAGGWTVVTFAAQLAFGLTGLIVVLVYLVFLLLDFPEYARTWRTFLPPQHRASIVEFLEQFSAVLRRYFRGQALVSLVAGVLFAIGFTLIGLPTAIPFGLFVGLLTMVPYLQAVALVPGMLLAAVRAIEGDSSFAMSVVLTLLVFAAVQVIQDTLITPRIMGKATGLRPVAILLGVFIWGKLLGFLGLLLAIPLTCLGIAYYRRYVLLHAPETPAQRSG